MKKPLFVSSLVVFFLPLLAKADQPLVRCTGPTEANGYKNDCQWPQLLETFQGILNTIIDKIAVPLGVIALVIGAVMLITSGTNPKNAARGKEVIFAAIIGLILVLCTKLIINFVLKVVGYTGPGL